MNKFHLKCVHCGEKFDSFKAWFGIKQVCPKCGKAHVEVQYSQSLDALKDLIFSKNRTDQSIWHYFDFLPLNDKNNIVSYGEASVNIEHWEFLEQYAKERMGIDCKVYATRNDENPATGTFKDPGASLAASVLKENGVDKYIVVSTGNVANAFARYMAQAGISLSAFVHKDAVKLNVAGVSCYGQRVFKVDGDYAYAKKVASEFAQKNNILMTGGNFDPLRVEAKRTMVFEWLRKMPELPTVYVQALSGGTGPIAIDKAYRDLQPSGMLGKYPRFLLVQPNGCAPMAEAWQNAKANGFPQGFEKEYPIYENPQTKVPTLATGNPGTYPYLAKLVQKTEGEIFEIDEEKLIDVNRMVAYENQAVMGPAAATAVAGFFKALRDKNIKNGDVVLISIGEGVRRATHVMEEMIYTEKTVKNADDCDVFDRKTLRKQLWDAV